MSEIKLDSIAERAGASEDGEWDSFLTTVVGGDHTQSSHWANLKSKSGWDVERLVIRDGGQMVAGAQILLKPFPIPGTGKFAYLQNGPVFGVDTPEVRESMLDTINHAARRQKVQYLAVMPPFDGRDNGKELENSGFRESALSISLSSTVMVDLSRSLDEILACMRSKTRYNIRLGMRQGIVVREGTEADIDLFHRLLHATGRRQSFSADDRAYLEDFWRILSPAGLCKLFVAEHEGVPLSAMMVVPFGQSVQYKRGAWGGQHPKLRPNEVMHWHAMQWAKTAGYRWYDFGGLDPNVARTIAEGGTLDPDQTKSVARFKLGFGGEIKMLHATYDRVFNPVLRLPYRAVMAGATKWPLGTRILQRARSRFRHAQDD